MKNVQVLNAYFKPPFDAKEILRCISLYTVGAPIDDIGYFYQLSKNIEWPSGRIMDEFITLITELFNLASIHFLISILDVILLKLEDQTNAIHQGLDKPEYSEKIVPLKIIVGDSLDGSELKNNSIVLIIDSLKEKKKRKRTPIIDTPLMEAIDALYLFSLLALANHEECLDLFFLETKRPNEKLSGVT